MFGSRDLALVSGFAALLLAYGYVSSIFLRSFTRSSDLFFLIAALFAILAVVVGRIGTASLLGTVTGLVFLGTPAPFPPHIAASLVSNGLVFDLYLGITNRTNPFLRRHIIVAAALGNFVMAVVGLATFQASGLVLPIQVWVLALVLDTLLGGFGALFGLKVAKRIRAPTTVAR